MTVQSTAEQDTDRVAGISTYTFLPWLLMGLGALSHLLQGNTGSPWLAAGGILAFNSLYVGVVFTAFHPGRITGRIPYVMLGALTALTFTLGLAYGSTWLFFFPLCSLAAGTLLRGRTGAVLLLAFGVAAGCVAATRSDDPWDGLAIGYGTLLSGMVTVALLKLVETVRMLRETREELARAAVDKERLRFSRDLHDLLGHTMSLIVVKAEVVRRLAPRDLDKALDQAADIETVGRQALAEIREAVSGYREGSLRIELERAGSLLEAAGIETVVRREGPPLAPRTETLLGWLVREGTTNAVRHSGASRCDIEVRATPEGSTRLTITDDGRGPVGSSPTEATRATETTRASEATQAGEARQATEASEATEAAGPASSAASSWCRPRCGTGLTGLAERLAAAGGTLDFGPDGRRGFRLVAELPADGEETTR